LQKLAKAEVIHASIVGNSRQILRARLFHCCNEILWDATKTKATNAHGRSIGQILYGLICTADDLAGGSRKAADAALQQAKSGLELASKT